MGSRATGSAVVTVNSFGTGTQSRSSITLLPDGGWVVAYASENLDGSGFGIAFQHYDAFGFRVGSETSVNEHALSSQTLPDVAMLADGGWIVTWASFGQDGADYEVYQRRYGNDGAPIGGETRVNSETVDTQSFPATIGLPDGGWVVVWQSEVQDGGFYGIYQQRYDADGLTVGGETLVNTTRAGSQTDADITVLSDGGWVVTWDSELQDGSSEGIYQQRFGADGQADGDETLVNTTTADAQVESVTAALSGGGWIVVWASNAQDGSGYGIYSQRFDPDGGRVGAEIRVNATTDGHQREPQVAVLADGGWVVVWELGTMGGSRLLQQRYDANGNPVGGETYLHPDDGNTNQLDAAVVGTPDGGWTISWTRDELELDGDTQVVQRHFAPDIVGTAGDDQLAGGFWGEAVFGYQGDDVLIGNGGDDILVGGLGDDFYIVNGSGDDVQEFNGQGYDSVTALVSFSIAGDSIEELRLNGTGNLNGFGNSIANTIYGNTGANELYGYNGNDAIDGSLGNDELYGGAGNDVLTGGEGNDRLVGSSGRDTASFANAAAAITVNLGLANSQNTGGAGTDTLIDMENAVGSLFNDSITGTDGDNTIEGGAGNDVLSGLLGIDTVSYASADAGVTVRLGQSTAQATGGAGTDTISGFENAAGSAFADVLSGNALDNALEGGAGDDILDGNGGIDTASYAAAATRVNVDLALVGAQNTLGAGSDTLRSIENLVGSAFFDTLRGSASANTIDAGAGNDFIVGEGGADKLIGGLGRDSLSGGAGADRFIFDDGDTGRTGNTADFIHDFSQAEGDRLALSQIDANSALSGDQAFTFIGSAEFSGAAGELRYEMGVDTYVFGDTNGDGFADFMILMDPVLTLVAADFIL